MKAGSFGQEASTCYLRPFSRFFNGFASENVIIVDAELAGKRDDIIFVASTCSVKNAGGLGIGAIVEPSGS